MPEALALGVSEERFWHMNPHRLRPYIKAKQIRNEEDDRSAWLRGLYVHKAIVAVLPVPKGQKHQEYPKKPYLDGYSKDHELNGELTEDAMKRKQDMMFHRMEIMRFNAELAKM